MIRFYSYLIIIAIILLGCSNKEELSSSVDAANIALISLKAEVDDLHSKLDDLQSSISDLSSLSRDDYDTCLEYEEAIEDNSSSVEYYYDELDQEFYNLENNVTALALIIISFNQSLR